MKQPSEAFPSHLVQRFCAGIEDGRRRGLNGADLTSFALMHLVADVLMLDRPPPMSLRPVPVRSIRHPLR